MDGNLKKSDNSLNIFDTHYNLFKLISLMGGFWPKQNKYVCFLLHFCMATISSILVISQVTTSLIEHHFIVNI